MCTELDNLRIFFRLVSPKIPNCMDKIKTGKQKEKATKSRQNHTIIKTKC